MIVGNVCFAASRWWFINCICVLRRRESYRLWRRCYWEAAGPQSGRSGRERDRDEWILEFIQSR